MDNPQTITHVSLCAGYGGIDLGLSRAIPSLRTVAFSEIEAFACANLVSKMEAGLLDCAPIWTNLKTFPWAEFYGRVDLLSGGYPCQPFSSAGKRLGTEDPRHLWPYIADGIRLMRPKLCFFENVEGHISLGLREVISKLESMGYKVSWGIFSAREVGAPHQRKRVFILAHRDRERGQLSDWWRIAGESLPVSHGETRRDELADTQMHGCHHTDERSDADGIQGSLGQKHEHRKAVRDGQLWPSRPGEQQHGWEPPRVVGDTKHNGSHQCGADTGGAESSSKQGRLQKFEGGSASVGNAEGGMPRQSIAGDWREGVGGAGEGGQLGNAAEQGCEGSGKTNDPRWTIDRPTEPNRGCAYGSMEQGQRQTQPPLGRDSNGIASGMDYAELQVSCDNRTDELRLLGNGVVPATAERAFRTLLAELIP